MSGLIAALLRNILARLLIYYGSVHLAFNGFFAAFPQLTSYVNAERLRGAGVSIDLDPNQIVSAGEQAQRASTYSILDPYTSIPIIFALLAVMALTVPVAWVYRWTRHPARYSASIAHALLVLPLAITLVVFLVKGSLALAFSLAGIVAAVRFRTALSESEDAVYMFVVIGIGLAAGVQLANVAFIASVFFNSVALLVWYLNFGARPALMNGWSLVPEEEAASVEIPTAEGPTTDKARYNTRLRLPTSDVENTQKAAIPLLDNAARAWRFAQVLEEGGQSVVEFEARLRGSVDVAALARDLEDSTFETGRVEVKKLKREKPLLEEATFPPPPSLEKVSAVNGAKLERAEAVAKAPKKKTKKKGGKTKVSSSKPDKASVKPDKASAKSDKTSVNSDKGSTKPDTVNPTEPLVYIASSSAASSKSESS